MEKIRYGMVGGDLHALIGEVHRKALAFDPRVELVCGSFSAEDDLNIECADAYGIPHDRVYYDYKEMAEKEADKIDFVIVCTPNNLHYSISKAFLEKGVNVMCEKPLCFTVEEGEELCAIAKEKDLMFGIDYCYTGYSMVKVMKEMVENGDIGDITAVNCEYIKDDSCSLLVGEVDPTARVWRYDPKISGFSSTCADIGTHMEHFLGYVTGLKIKRVAATVDRYGENMLDYNNNILVEYENGVHGAYWFSQVIAGKSNEMRMRIYGTKGGLEWEQIRPDRVIWHRVGEASQRISRSAKNVKRDYESSSLFRLPYGHPEGYYLCLCNIYRNWINCMLKKKAGIEPDAEDLDWPHAEAGIEGVKFTKAVIDSANNDSAWMNVE